MTTTQTDDLLARVRGALTQAEAAFRARGDTTAADGVLAAARCLAHPAEAVALLDAAEKYTSAWDAGDMILCVERGHPLLQATLAFARAQRTARQPHDPDATLARARAAEGCGEDSEDA